MRVNISAIGSVIIFVEFSHYQLDLRSARNQSLVRQFAETNPADAELPVHRAAGRTVGNAVFDASRIWGRAAISQSSIY